jgi:hypothetical protein
MRSEEPRRYRAKACAPCRTIGAIELRSITPHPAALRASTFPREGSRGGKGLRPQSFGLASEFKRYVHSITPMSVMTSAFIRSLTFCINIDVNLLSPILSR